MFNVLSKYSTIKQTPNKAFIAILGITLSYSEVRTAIDLLLHSHVFNQGIRLSRYYAL